MGRLKTMALGVLNIKTQPHSPEKYYDLFSHLFTVKPIVKIRGSDYGMPASFYKANQEDPLDGICGSFFRYLEFDQSSPWIDLTKHEPIVDENGIPIPQVDADKRPNVRTLEFVFYPKGHRLFFNREKISPKVAQDFVERLFSDDKIKNKFGVVDIEVETAQDALKHILKIPTMTKLDIKFSRPNDDELVELEEMLVKRITSQNVRKFDQRLSSDKDEGISPDDETKALMNVALSNGLVTAEGYARGEKVEESTEEHPFVHREKYDTNLQTFMSAMISISSNILGNFTNRKAK